MTSPDSHPSLEDVLAAFAVEQDADRTTLERYLRKYPQFAEDLVDLSQQLSRVILDESKTLSTEEQALIDAGWKRLSEASPAPAADPLATLSVHGLRALAQALDVPRQIITNFRERKVVISSVPRRFITRFAAAVNVPIDQLMDAWSSDTPTATYARSYKSDGKPTAQQVTFEQILIDAGLSPSRRAELLSED